MDNEDPTIYRAGANLGAAAAGPANPTKSNTVTTDLMGGVTRVQITPNSTISGPTAAPPESVGFNPDAGYVTRVYADGTVEQTAEVSRHVEDGVRLTGGNGASILSTA